MTIEDNLKGKKRVISLDILPLGEFRAPIFLIDKRENHGKGYHAHVLVLNNGKYVRSGYLLTYEDEKVYISEHGNKGNTLFDFEKRKSALVEEIARDLPKVFRGIPKTQYLKRFKDAQLLCNMEGQPLI